MELLLIGIAVSFNILIILYKFKRDRLLDGALDLTLMCAVTYVFMGSFNALVVGTIASAIVSIYLLIYPIKVKESN